jgi:hypothetical protein
MRFFSSFHYAQNDSDLGDFGQLGEMVLRLRRKTISPNCKSIQVLVIPMRSKPACITKSGRESH